MTTFKQAYNQAKKAGKGIFTWKGKTYNTMSKGDTVDEFRKKYADYDAFIGNLPKDTGGWKVKDGVALANKLNYVPEPMTQQPVDQSPTQQTVAQQPLALFSNDDIRQLGFRNYNGLVSAVSNQNNANNNFIRALVARYGNDTSKWNQKQIEKDLGVKGTYRSFGSGDFGDMSRNMASWLGTHNGSLAKPNESTNYWVSKYIMPQIPQLSVPQFKLYKNGGQMINYYQQGGQAQDMQQQVIQLVQAAMQGDQQANQSIKQIMDAAQKGDQQAAQIAQLIQQVVQQMQSSRKARLGAKLVSKQVATISNPIEAFKNGCKIKKDSCGKKLLACGGKSKKKKLEKGGWLNESKGIWDWDSADRMNRVTKYYQGKENLTNDDYTYLQQHQDLQNYLSNAYKKSKLNNVRTAIPKHFITDETSANLASGKSVTYSAPEVTIVAKRGPYLQVARDRRRNNFHQWSNFVNQHAPQYKGRFMKALQNIGYTYDWNTGQYNSHNGSAYRLNNGQLQTRMYNGGSWYNTNNINGISLKRY